MSQSNTHSSADVLSTRRFAMKAAPCGVSMEEVDPDARGFVYYLCSDIDPAVAALLARNAELEAERDEALRRANRADARVKGWEATMVVANLPRRICPVDGWGPGEGETVEIPSLTPERLTEILDRVDALAAENKALQSRLSGLADHCRRVYDVVPQLPIDERSMEGATDALHAFCIMLGVNGIDIDAARNTAKGNDDG